MTMTHARDAVREYLNDCSTEYEAYETPEYLFSDWTNPAYLITPTRSEEWYTGWQFHWFVSRTRGRRAA